MLKYFALSFFFAATALSAQTTCAPNFAFEGFTQPSQWRYINAQCAIGQQSPIAIGTPFVNARNAPITVTYQPMPITVRNTGYDFRVLSTRNNRISVSGIGTATLDNFHFHTPAEHSIPGYGQLAGEIHFVHRTAAGRIVAIAVLLTNTGASNNAALQPIIAQLPIHLCDTKVTTVNVNPLLPASIPAYYRYTGSLTTPGCNPDVTFLVLPTPMSIGASQLSTLAHFGKNARPPQTRIMNPLTTITHVTP